MAARSSSLSGVPHVDHVLKPTPDDIHARFVTVIFDGA
jgi:hypothetical protein